MAQSLTSKTVEFASGEEGPMPFNLDSATSYLYPLVQTVPGDLGGLSTYRAFNGTASTNATSVKAAAGMVYGYRVTSVSPEANYLKFYDKASAPTVGTDTPKITIGIPIGNTTLQNVSEFWPQGIAFSTGIAFSITEPVSTAIVSIDSESQATDTANEISVTIYYK